jgi:hypothetical protein
MQKNTIQSRCFQYDRCGDLVRPQANFDSGHTDLNIQYQGLTGGCRNGLDTRRLIFPATGFVTVLAGEIDDIVSQVTMQIEQSI